MKLLSFSIAPGFLLAAKKLGIPLDLDLAPHFNIAPQANIPALWVNHKGAGGMMKWGLTPEFWKQGEKSKPLHNARAESIWSRVNFRKLIGHQHCVLLANGFYEWDRSGKVKQPYWIGAHNTLLPLCLAGIWQTNHEGQKECSIITTSANKLIEPVHNRMPVILDRAGCRGWLEAKDKDTINHLMVPCASEWLKMYPVSAYVNSTRNMGDKCLERVFI